MDDYRCLSTIGMLGYGIPEESLRAGVARRPHMIGADAGSTDAGPHKLGRGVPDVSAEATARDLALMLRAGRELGVPVVIGSSGGSGARPHLEWTWTIVREVAARERLRVRVALVHAEVPKELVARKFAAGQVRPLGAAPALEGAALEATGTIVAQMGIEPIVRALDGGADLVLAGRACDAAVFAAPAIRAGADSGLAWHAGEILECGAMCAEPGSANDCMLGVIESDRFVIEPMNTARACTPASVACHSLYERSHPSRSEGPGHVLDLAGCRFEALDARRVAVSGSRYRRVPLRVKLEGAALAGYRTIVIGGMRDPVGIERLDETLGAVETATADYFAHLAPGDYALRFVVYGRDGVMGRLEPTPRAEGHEVGILLDVVARTQTMADTVCAFARSQLQHYHYKGILATGANIAFPTAPSDIPVGSVYRFTVYHLMDVDDPCELFPVEFRDLA